MLGTLSVWTLAEDEPRRLGRLQFDGERSVFEYDREAADLPGIGLAYDPKRLVGHRIPWTATHDEPLHPIFMSLVPPCDATNLQYRIAAKALGFTRDTLHEEWLMLPFLGHGSLGHLDVFETDAEAIRWYRGEMPKPADLADGEIVTLALDALAAGHDPIALDRVIEAVGRAPSPGGAMPKIMHRIVWPGSEAAVDAIVKFERVDGKRPDLLLLEDWAYGVHERIGLTVPRRALFRDPKGNHVLATERFDRMPGRCVPMESVYSVLKSYAPEAFPDPFTRVYGTEPNFEMVAAAFANPRTGMTVDVAADCRDLYTRIVLSFLTANGDLHLRNLSILGPRGAARLSPVYDPAPMRLFGGVDMHTAVTFGNLRFYGPRLPDGFAEALLELGKSFRLPTPTARSIVDDAFELTRHAADEILAAGATAGTVSRFVDLVAEVRSAIEGTLVRRPVPKRPERRRRRVTEAPPAEGPDDAPPAGPAVETIRPGF